MFESLAPWLDVFTQNLAALPREWVLTAIALPVFLSIVSRRVTVFLATLLLGFVALMMVEQPIQPASAMLIAFCSFVGSAITAIAGISAAWRHRNLVRQITELQENLHQMEAERGQRVLAELRSQPSREQEGAEITTLPRASRS